MAELDFRRMEKRDVPATLEVRLSMIENAITLKEMERDYGVTPAGIMAAMDADVAGYVKNGIGCSASQWATRPVEKFWSWQCARMQSSEE